ncbi:MAG TPA: class I SAM-dependent methyltransferase [Dehalococcoidia bacterium]
MNLFHRWYCRSGGWARIVKEHMLPAILRDVDLGENVIEIGPGPGVTTEWLSERLPRLTAIEIDSALARKLKARMADTNVTVVEGDGTKLTMPDGEFSGAVCFTMLHHVPSPELQDRLFAEVCRVLQPGGLYVGADSTPSLFWRLAHIADTAVVVDPETLQPRLEAAGFTDVTVNVRKEGGFNFRARRPA